jgi:hypothetical protein
MQHIILTEEQTRILQSRDQPIEIRTSDGRVLTVIKPLSQDEREAIEESKRRLAKPGRRIPSEKVGALLARALEIDQTEGMTREKMDELLRRLRAGEPL